MFNPTTRQFAFRLHMTRRLPLAVTQNMTLEQFEFIEEELKPFDKKEYGEWLQDEDFVNWLFSPDDSEAMFMRAQRNSLQILNAILDHDEMPALEKLPAAKIILSLAASAAKAKSEAKAQRALQKHLPKELAKKSEDDLKAEIAALRDE
jgi:hypothetical protein